MKTKTVLAALSLALGANAQELDRTVLPIAEPTYKPVTTLDARDAKAPPRFEVKAPQGAPNVVIVLIDDIGFGSSSAVENSPPWKPGGLFIISDITLESARPQRAYPGGRTSAAA